MSNNFLFRNVVLLLVMLSVAGCIPTTHRVYKGFRRPLDEVAIIRGTEASYFRVQIRNVDGKKLDPDNGFANIVHVLPGRRKVTALFAGAGWSTQAFFEVDVEAGETYEVRFDADATFGDDGAVDLRKIYVYAVNKGETVLSVDRWTPLQRVEINIPITITIGN